MRNYESRLDVVIVTVGVTVNMAGGAYTANADSDSDDVGTYAQAAGGSVATRRMPARL